MYLKRMRPHQLHEAVERGDPLLVRIGGTRFALRRVEAARITVEPDIPES